MTHTVALIGPSGAGKSTVGRLLARRWHVPLADVDAQVEQRAGQSIAAMFAEHGEAHFRAWERDVTLEALRGGGVVSLGGGAPLTPAIADALADVLVVWLRVDADAAAARVAHHDDRPLLSGGSRRDTLAAMIEARSGVYAACADHVVDTADRTPAQVADAVEALLGPWPPTQEDA